MYEDIVANTDPVVGVLQIAAGQLLEANAYINPSMAFFSAKRNLLRHSNFDRIAPISRSVSSFCSDLDQDKIEFESEDAIENLSEFIDDQDQGLVNEFIKLEPRHCQPKTRSEFDDKEYQNLRIVEGGMLELAYPGNPEDQEMVQWEEHNRSCCHENDDFKDIGLDSTLSLSMVEGRQRNKNYFRKNTNLLSERSFSQVGNKILDRPQKSKETIASQFNFNDLEENEDLHYQDLDFHPLQAAQHPNFIRQRSLRVSFAQSDAHAYHNLIKESFDRQ